MQLFIEFNDIFDLLKVLRFFIPDGLYRVFQKNRSESKT